MSVFATAQVMTHPGMKIEGSCLCGKVRIVVSEPFHAFYFCHCSKCQKASGSAHATNLFSGLNSVSWLSGEEMAIRFELSENSHFNKCFCRECGSPLPSRAKSGRFTIVPAGSLDHPPSLLPTQNIFWEDRAQWYEAGCQAPKHRQHADID